MKTYGLHGGSHDELCHAIRAELPIIARQIRETDSKRERRALETRFHDLSVVLDFRVRKQAYA
jgi:hypothetical protein